MSALRSLRRYVAKKQMKREGLTKICKGGYFRKNWRYV